MDTRRAVELLTKRQREVLELIALERTNFEIAQHLGISLDGAKWHVREVLARLDVGSREDAAVIWRRDRSSKARVLAVLAGAAKLASGRAALAVAAGIVAVATAAGLMYLVVGDDDPPVAPEAPPTSSPTVPTAPLTELAPHSGIPIVDEVIDLVNEGDLVAFRRLMKEFPEPCTTKQRGVGSPPACPAGAPDGTLVDTFRAVASERIDPGPDLDQVLANVVPTSTRLYVVLQTTFDRFPETLPPSRYEVVVLQPQPASGPSGAIYFLDDTGIVGLYAGDVLRVLAHLDDAQPADWIIAPPTAVQLNSDKDLYVLGRDGDARFDVALPPVCAGKPLAIRLYGYPDPGVPGGIQAIREPGILDEVRTVADPSGRTNVSFPLPATASTPIHVRPGVLAPCLAEIAVQGEFQLALLAPQEDAEVATFELLGEFLDQPNQFSGTIGAFLGGELTAAVDGVACTTVSLVDSALRNPRGNVVFRVGATGQPAQCRAPGHVVTFLMSGRGGGTAPLFEKPVYVPGVIQLIRNFAPEPITN